MSTIVATSRVAQILRALRSTMVPGGDSLRRKLWLGMAFGIVCMATLAAFVMVDHVAEYRASQADLFDIQRFREVLDVANGLSAERGPANSVMGEEPSRESASSRRLAAFRARNDAALAQLAVHLAAWQSERDGTVGPAALADTTAALAEARADVDRVAATPASARAIAPVQHAVQRMFRVVDVFSEVTSELANDMLKRHDGIKAQLFAAEMLGDLREYAGRIASEIMPSITVRQRLRTDEIIASSRTRGRLGEIWDIIGRQDALCVDDPDIEPLRAAVQSEFFGQGMALFDHMVEQGVDSGLYDLTPTAFTMKFVPLLAPIERLRTAVLDAWVARSVVARDRSLAILLVVGGSIGLTMVALAGLAASVQRHVFVPLLIARERVIALAEERNAAVRTALRPRGEMRRLFESIEELQAKVRERALLTQQLRRQVDTDLLTGLPNRRALHRVAGQRLGRWDGEAGMCLIMIDLDHFKAINDRHGHLAGDEALRQVAACLVETVAARGTPARFGGEEFAVLVPTDDLAAAFGMAQAIRAALVSRDVRVAGGLSIRLTASFGVAASERRGGTWDSLVARADAALYRAKSEGRDRVCRTLREGEALTEAADGGVRAVAMRWTG